MSRTNSNKSSELKGYAKKRRAGMVPHQYDRNSVGYHKGAWKNWSPDEQRRMQNRMESRV